MLFEAFLITKFVHFWAEFVVGFNLSQNSFSVDVKLKSIFKNLRVWGIHVSCREVDKVLEVFKLLGNFKKAKTAKNIDINMAFKGKRIVDEDCTMDYDIYLGSENFKIFWRNSKVLFR